MCSSSLRRRSSLAGRTCILRSGISRLLRLRDTSLRAIIGALDRAIIRGRSIIQLVGLLHQRRGLRTHVILG